VKPGRPKIVPLSQSSFEGAVGNGGEQGIKLGGSLDLEAVIHREHLSRKQRSPSLWASDSLADLP
jgi:hypothetical protein